jgi:hypothetical protein
VQESIHKLIVFIFWAHLVRGPTFWFGQIMVITVVWILHRVISNLVLRIVGVMCLAHRAFKVFDHPDLGLTWFVVQTILFKCDQSLVCHRA